MTRIIARNVPPVKPTRLKARKPGHSFGRGILATRPSYRTAYTASDAAWWAAEQASREDRHYDALAGESLGHDRLEAGTL